MVVDLQIAALLNTIVNQQVYLDKTTEKVVTMEYVPGIKVNDIARIEQAGINRELLAKRSAESYLTQICRHGFFRKSSLIQYLLY